MLGITDSGDFVSNLRGIIQSPFNREVPVLKVAEDLYNYISSFGACEYSIEWVL